jgi:hypothetical protein
MAYQIIKKAGTKWIKQPNRIVKTFPSGLCLVQQEYIAARSDVDYFAFKEGDVLSEKDSAPCIDGAYIFPSPQYQDMGNGFIKCTVTAYGRTKATGQLTQNINPLGGGQIQIFYPNRGYSFDITVSGYDPNGTLLTQTVNVTPDLFYFTVDVISANYIFKTVKSESEQAFGLDELQIETNPISVKAFDRQEYIPWNDWINAIMSAAGQSFFTYQNSQYRVPRNVSFETGYNVIGSAGWEETTSLLRFNQYIKRGRGLFLGRRDSENFGFFTEFTINYLPSAVPYTLNATYT